MAKLLFVAGEPGSGKTEFVLSPLRNEGLGFPIETDKVCSVAAKHYSRCPGIGCRWQLWKLEFDNADCRRDLKTAFRKAILGELRVLPTNVIVEGVLSVHPEFRAITLEILEEFGFYPSEVLAIAPLISKAKLLQNLAKRGRSEDKNFGFVDERSRDYRERLRAQDRIECYETPEDCYRVALEFLGS